MSDIVISPVIRADLDLLHNAMQELSAALGDRHVADIAALEAGGFGPEPAFRAQLARRSGVVVGALVYSPLFSTTRGGAGLYVSDLWVAQSARGCGLGRRLLARALSDAEARGGACFVKLSVYDDNPLAQRFYHQIGFDAQPLEFNMILQGAALNALKGTP